MLTTTVAATLIRSKRQVCGWPSPPSGSRRRRAFWYFFTRLSYQGLDGDFRWFLDRRIDNFRRSRNLNSSRRHAKYIRKEIGHETVVAQPIDCQHTSILVAVSLSPRMTYSS